MTASTVNSTGVANLLATPQILAPAGSRGFPVIAQDIAAMATTSLDDVGDLVMCCPIPTNAIIRSLKFMNDDLDSNGSPTVSIKVGLYYSGVGGDQAANGKVYGTEAKKDCFSTGSTFFNAAVTTSPVDVRYSALNISTYGDEAWKNAGLTSDPGGLFFISLYIGAVSATPAAGNIVVVCDYITRA